MPMEMNHDVTLLFCSYFFQFYVPSPLLPTHLHPGTTPAPILYIKMALQKKELMLVKRNSSAVVFEIYLPKDLYGDLCGCRTTVPKGCASTVVQNIAPHQSPGRSVKQSMYTYTFSLACCIPCTKLLV